MIDTGKIEAFQITKNESIVVGDDMKGRGINTFSAEDRSAIADAAIKLWTRVKAQALREMVGMR